MRNWISLAGMTIGAAVVLACAGTQPDVGTAPQPTLRKDIHLEGSHVLRFMMDTNFVEGYREIVQGTRTPRGSCAVLLKSVPGYKITSALERDESTCQFVLVHGNLRTQNEPSTSASAPSRTVVGR
jgi:hypothetical protein